MIFFVYTPETTSSIADSLGLADYSYFFVMEKFLPILARYGMTVTVNDIDLVRAAFKKRLVRESDAVLFCFVPPHRMPQEIPCPVIDVFAWEYSSIPNESWGNDARQNWVQVLRNTRAAITHSKFAEMAVRHELPDDYPIAALPAPVWDTYARRSNDRALRSESWQLVVEKGVLLDSSQHLKAVDGLVAPPSFVVQRHQATFTGIIYTAVFNPNDGRKNWTDLISAFCFAFRDNPHVTLIMKLVYSDVSAACGMVWHQMQKLGDYRCRVVAIQGYLDAVSYQKLVANSTYIVNSSHGEGQCLPLMEFMSAGKPAIAPEHTSMADYIHPNNAFVVRSSEEWTHWPHDPRLLLQTFRYRIDWESLRDALLESYRVVEQQPDRYQRMSSAAVASLQAHCSEAIVSAGLENFLSRLGYQKSGAQSVIKDFFLRVFVVVGKNKAVAKKMLLMLWRGFKGK